MGVSAGHICWHCSVGNILAFTMSMDLVAPVGPQGSTKKHNAAGIVGNCQQEWSLQPGYNFH